MLKQVQHDKKDVIASTLPNKKRLSIVFCEREEAIQLIEAPHPNPPRSRGGKKIAFTLAEVLITLGIIGIVAAMTIPTLVTKIQIHQLRHQLKQTYSDLNQAAMLFKEDHDEDIPSWTSTNGAALRNSELYKYIKGYTKISNGISSLPYDMYTLKGRVNYGIACDNSGFFTDLRGRVYSFDDKPIAGYNGPRVCVDINGSKKPNTLGIDIFTFLFTTDGHVIPEGADHKDNNYEEPFYSKGTMKAVGNGSLCGSYYSIICTFYAINDQSPKGDGTYWDDFIGKKQYKN